MPVQHALGKYAHAVSAGVVLCILVAWAAVHLGDAFGFVRENADTSQLDTFALAAFTYLLGNVSALNGVKPDLEAANRRLDAVGAPAAASVAADHPPAPSGGPGA